MVWALYRQSLLAGRCERILNELMINCMVDHWKIEYCQQGTLGEFLEANPDLLENEFWFMFEHEFQEIWQDGSEPGLTSPLNKTFVTLTQKGKINRDRFLDSILNVFHFNYSDDDFATCSAQGVESRTNTLPT